MDVPREFVSNIDRLTVEGFGQEWSAYDQTALDESEHERLFERYFSVFPLDTLLPDAEGFDLGCGSGRWAEPVARRVGTLHCIDPSVKALDVARRRLAGIPSAHFHNAGVDSIPLADCSQDFGYSLGVLHHIPDVGRALTACVRKLKPGAPFLLYIYYRFDNRPAWFGALWRVSDFGRRVISRLPFPLRKAVATTIAATVYWPLAAAARFAERLGRDVGAYPLSFYRNLSFYTMRTDALDRFGTRLEQRFTRSEISTMMTQAGLVDITFYDGEPYWVACGRKAWDKPTEARALSKTAQNLSAE